MNVPWTQVEISKFLCLIFDSLPNQGLIHITKCVTDQSIEPWMSTWLVKQHVVTEQGERNLRKNRNIFVVVFPRRWLTPGRQSGPGLTSDLSRGIVMAVLLSANYPLAGRKGQLSRRSPYLVFLPGKVNENLTQFHKSHRITLSVEDETIRLNESEERQMK